jgi:hypothetical protein
MALDYVGIKNFGLTAARLRPMNFPSKPSVARAEGRNAISDVSIDEGATRRRTVLRQASSLSRKELVMHASKSEVSYQNNQALEGIEKHLFNVKSVPIFGAQTRLAEIKSVLRAALAMQAKVDVARAQLRELVAQSRAADASAARVRRALRAYVVVHHGPDARGVLADFGFVPKPREQTVQAKAVAVGKRLETRKLRHTMGKRQKARVKAGAVPPPQATPAPAPSTSASNGASNGVAPTPTSDSA